MKTEYRIECDACGWNEIMQRKPKRTPWHWPRRVVAYGPKKCWATPRISTRKVTAWEAQ